MVFYLCIIVALVFLKSFSWLSAKTNHPLFFLIFLPDDDFDYTVSGEHWKEVLGAVKSQNEDQLKSLLQELDGEVQKQRLVDS